MELMRATAGKLGEAERALVAGGVPGQACDMLMRAGKYADALRLCERYHLEGLPQALLALVRLTCAPSAMMTPMLTVTSRTAWAACTSQPAQDRCSASQLLCVPRSGRACHARLHIHTYTHTHTAAQSLQAQEQAGQGELQAAEELWLRADNPGAVLAMYRQAKRWKQASRVAHQYFPEQVCQLHLQCCRLMQ